METPIQTAGIIDLPDDEKESAAGLPATPRETNNREQSSPIKYAWQVSPDPWPEYVDGQALLNEMHGVFNRYLVLPEHAAAALTTSWLPAEYQTVLELDQKLDYVW